MFDVWGPFINSVIKWYFPNGGLGFCTCQQLFIWAFESMTVPFILVGTITPKGISQYLPLMLTWLCCSLSVDAQNKVTFPCRSPIPSWGTGDSSLTSGTPGGFPRHNSHWADLCLHTFVKTSMSTIHTFKNMPAGLIFKIFQDSVQKHLKLYLCNQNQCNIEVIILKTKTIGWHVSSSDGLIHQQEIQQVITVR